MKEMPEHLNNGQGHQDKISSEGRYYLDRHTFYAAFSLLAFITMFALYVASHKDKKYNMHSSMKEECVLQVKKPLVKVLGPSVMVRTYVKDVSWLMRCKVSVKD